MPAMGQIAHSTLSGSQKVLCRSMAPCWDAAEVMTLLFLLGGVSHLIDAVSIVLFDCSGGMIMNASSAIFRNLPPDFAFPASEADSARFAYATSDGRTMFRHISEARALPSTDEGVASFEVKFTHPSQSGCEQVSESTILEISFDGEAAEFARFAKNKSPIR